jgi:hypothetical protein
MRRSMHGDVEEAYVEMRRSMRGNEEKHAWK